ncbi:MAG: uroporphyrinogen decarboxylase family protein, partial [Dehalococcoidales bacterium]|nr:uroporphyrinogen decarboxylase family protein [Dehalococcoidales bacterium]
LSILAYLAGDTIFLAHQRVCPDRIKPALEAVTETSVRFAGEAIGEGADGIFLSTRFASFEMMPEQEYMLFARSSDLAVLEASRNGWFNVLHLHGQYPMLAQLADYPVGALNWHDRTTPFSLNEAGKLFQGALMGGIEQYKLLRFGGPQDVEAQAREAIDQMKGRRLIVSPGCTYPLDVPHANLLALRRAVEIIT